jgi:F-type H+-transporting ATPase subunit delta
MEAVQQSVASARAAVVPVASVNGVTTSRVVSQVRMSFVSGRGSSLRGNALIAKVAKAASVPSSSSSRGVVVASAETAAGGYAAALADLSQSNNDLEKIAKDMEGLGELLNNDTLYNFLVSPIIDGDKKKSIIKTVAEDAEFSAVTLSFLNLLVDKKRIDIVREVTKEFEAIYNELTDTQVANVISAVKIEKPQLALIAKKIQSLCGAKNVRIKNVVDPSLIAGFIVQYGKDGSRYIDMSVKGQLDKLASQFAAAEQVAA